MKRRYRILAISAGVILVVWWYSRTGRDVFGSEQGDPMLWEPSHPAATRKGMK